ncbi:MAG: DUF4234 domain-containing protein [Deltaproteobacteria bacterium]|nr:DUF4234 domain-containing protein [Deltaproteobacteria bacterium]
MTAPIIERREPALVLVLSIITLGIYLPFWYHGIYEDLQKLDGRTPTGHGFWLDFLFVLLTGSALPKTPRSSRLFSTSLPTSPHLSPTSSPARFSRTNSTAWSRSSKGGSRAAWRFRLSFRT